MYPTPSHKVIQDQIVVLEKLRKTSCIGIGTTGLVTSELYSILKKIKRERKKIKDEENWRKFSEQIQETQMKKEELVATVTSPVSERPVKKIPVLCNDCENKCFNSASLGDTRDVVYHLINDSWESRDDHSEICDKLQEIDTIWQKIGIIIKNIYELLRNKKSLPIDNSEVENQALEFIEIFKDFNCICRGVGILHHKSKSTLKSSLTEKLMKDFQNQLHALEVIENQVTRNPFIEPIKDVLCSCLNKTYSLLVMYKYLYENGDNKMDFENLILEALHFLQNYQFNENNETTDRKPDEIQPKPDWIKESVALARIKFGPPDKARNQKNSQDLLSKPHVEAGMEENNCSIGMSSSSTGSEAHNSSSMELLENYDNDKCPSNSNKTTSINQENFKRSNCTPDEEINQKISGKIDPKKEETISKHIAKKIQEIPGVDSELRKIEDLRIKMMSTLLNIKVTICKNFQSSFLTTSDEFYERINQRTIEFAARFKRNYSYRTKCQLNELKATDTNPLLIKRKSKVITVIQKLTAVHQGVLQALQVIEKQLQTVAVIGLTKEVFFIFYHYIYELTFMLKPFYGFMKTQVLDEVEKLVYETTKLLKELKYEHEMARSKNCSSKTKEIKQKSKSNEGKGGKKDKVVTPKKSPYNSKLKKKLSKQSINNKVEEKTAEESKEEKYLNFMMSIKQRPGAINRDRIKNDTQEPKTMVEMLADSEPEMVEPNVPAPISSNENENITHRSEELKKPKLPKLEKITPPNVKLITIKRDDTKDEEMNLPQRTSRLEWMDSGIWHSLIKYRNEFTVYKKSNPLYNKKSLQTVKGITEKLMDEALSVSLARVLNKINLQDLTALKTIMEEEIK